MVFIKWSLRTLLRLEVDTLSSYSEDYFAPSISVLAISRAALCHSLKDVFVNAAVDGIARYTIRRAITYIIRSIALLVVVKLYRVAGAAVKSIWALQVAITRLYRVRNTATLNSSEVSSQHFRPF